MNTISWGGWGWIQAEDITPTANGLDEALGEIAIHLVAQVMDGDVDDIGEWVEVFVPGLFGEAGAGGEFAGVAGEAGKDGEFLGGQGNGFSGAGHGLTSDIQLQVGNLEEFGFCGSGSAEEGADAGEQFGEGEGFDEVIIGPGFEAVDTIADGITGGEHEDAGGGPGVAELGKDIETIFAGEQDIQDEEVVKIGGSEVEAVLSVIGVVHLEAFLAQAADEEASDLGIVFDEEDSHGMRGLGIRDGEWRMANGEW